LIKKILVIIANFLAWLSRKLLPADISLIQDVAWNSLHPHVIGTCLKQNIPDLLLNESLSLATLSEKTGIKQDPLQRLLRAMQLFEIVDKTSDGKYELSRVGKVMTTTNPMYNTLRLMGAEWAGEFSQLSEIVVNSGRPLHSKFQGNFFAYAENDQELKDSFDKAMVESEASMIPCFLNQYDMSGYNHVVDVGGGRGVFLLEILNKYHPARATLFDDIEKIEHHDDRFEFVRGNFFEAIPEGGDLYILKNILHDWGDEQAAIILKNIRDSVKAKTKLLIITLLMSDSNSNLDLVYMDLMMMTVFGGKERTLAQYNKLFSKTGFKFIRCENIVGGQYYLEVEAV